MLACTTGGHLHGAVSKGLVSHRLMMAFAGHTASAAYMGEQPDQLITGATPLLGSLAGQVVAGLADVHQASHGGCEACGSL